MDEPGGRPTALVVDDDRDIREALKEILEDEGYPVATAANGREALAVLARLPRPCVVLLDLMMPVMDGWEFLREGRARAALTDVPVFVVTASSIAEAPAGATALLKKPFDISRVLKILQEHCGG
jgi:CheY-like chemotaxis protein